VFPVIQGFAEFQPLTLKGKQVSYGLIARRSRFRLGPRYQARGIDFQGHVANFVETEQVLYVHSTGELTSHLQIRGSMPFFWKQVINLKYQPTRVIDTDLPSVSGFWSLFSLLFMANEIHGTPVAQKIHGTYGRPHRPLRQHHPRESDQQKRLRRTTW
jgi:hypothetical protein